MIQMLVSWKMFPRDLKKLTDAVSKEVVRKNSVQQNKYERK